MLNVRGQVKNVLAIVQRLKKSPVVLFFQAIKFSDKQHQYVTPYVNCGRIQGLGTDNKFCYFVEEILGGGSWQIDCFSNNYAKTLCFFVVVQHGDDQEQTSGCQNVR